MLLHVRLPRSARRNHLGNGLTSTASPIIPDVRVMYAYNLTGTGYHHKLTPQNCNAGFLVPPIQRGKKIGGALAKSFVEYAPRLGYRASVFNLVYDSKFNQIYAAHSEATG